MGRTRKHHSTEFKAKVALEAVKGVQSLGELATRYKVHPTQIAQWKKQLTRNAAQVFERGGSGAGVDAAELTAKVVVLESESPMSQMSSRSAVVLDHVTLPILEEVVTAEVAERTSDSRFSPVLWYAFTEVSSQTMRTSYHVLVVEAALPVAMIVAFPLTFSSTRQVLFAKNSTRM